MSFALGLLAGVQKGMLVLLLGMLSAVIVRAVFQRKKIKLAFAFLPYLAGAAIRVMFIF